MGNNVEYFKNDSLGEDFSNLPQWDQLDQGEHKADIWKSEHVKLPFSSMNINEDTNRSMWQTITISLHHLSKSLDTCEGEAISEEVKNAISKYRPEYTRDGVYNFTNLIFLFGSYSGPDSIDTNQNDLRQLLKKMIESAKNLKKLIPKPIPLLRKGTSMSLSLNSEQCASLLANCFFCTFPTDHTNNHLNNPNFIRLFTDKANGRNETKVEKLKCILHYFKRVLISTKENSVKTFSRYIERTAIASLLGNSKKPIMYPIFELHEKIEDLDNTTQLDFANKYLGGGVLGNGCVQEEIRFAICPEMCVALIFTESLDENEAFYFTGCERFSKYTGYAGTFKFAGDFVDRTPKDSYNRLCVRVLAIDALKYDHKIQQFDWKCLDRELLKCFSGFCHSRRAIATGNWGCGAFNGIIELKYLIQLLAASESNRALIYCTVGSQETIEKLNKMNKIIAQRYQNVSQLYKLLIGICQLIFIGKYPGIDLENIDFGILINNHR